MSLKPEHVALLPSTGEAMRLRSWLNHLLGRRVPLAYHSDDTGRMAAPRCTQEPPLATLEARIADISPAKNGAA